MDLHTVETNAETLAQIWGISTEAVYNFVKQGMPRTGRGKYPLKECSRWFVAYLYDRIGAGSADLADERRGLVKAQRQREEIRNRQMLGELLPAEMVTTTLNAMATIYAGQLDGLGSRLGAKLAATDDPAAVVEIINDETRSIRVATSEATIDLASVGGNIEDIKPAAKKKRGRLGRRKSKATAGKSGTGTVAHG